ncbi:MAG: response regulator [Methanomassiliicoccales archaeon]|nr:MAG: response regulator [Methanomassiliicoccales archaeon]
MMRSALYIDDDPSMLDVVKTYLEFVDDLKVDTVACPRRALEIVENYRYDTIICDYSMPGMNGVEFLKEFRERDRETPFILFTALDYDRLEGWPFPACFFVQKGADISRVFEDLALTIDQVMKDGL